jgi:hypothetical protein
MLVLFPFQILCVLHVLVTDCKQFWIMALGGGFWSFNIHIMFCVNWSRDSKFEMGQKHTNRQYGNIIGLFSSSRLKYTSVLNKCTPIWKTTHVNSTDMYVSSRLVVVINRSSTWQ